MTEPEYRQVSAISYSKLSGVSKSPASLLSDGNFDTPSLVYGSAVDTLTFDGEEEFLNKFAINSGESPSKIVEKITREVMAVILQTYGEYKDTLDDYDDIILEVAKANEYGKGWHNPTILRKIKEEGGSSLYSFTIENEGKRILDTLEWQNVRNSANTLFTHDFTSKWLMADEGEEVLFQFPILWTYKGKPCKSLFDIIKIDHTNKVIYPVDLKTSYDHVLGFPKNFIKWCYYLQASFYTEALKYYKLQYPELLNYRIANFRFIILSSQDPFKPLVYKTTAEDLHAGKYGGIIKMYNDAIRGFDGLIDDMQWHTENQKYDYPKAIYEKDGELYLGVF